MRKTIALLGWLATGALAQDGVVPVPLPTESLVFARYIASLHELDPFTEMGPTRVTIEASLPGGREESRLVAIRDIGDTERSEYNVVEMDDGSRAWQLIMGYLDAQAQVEDLPLSRVLVVPDNYRFRRAGVVMDEGRVAFVYRITPKHKRAGLIRGELWIDAATGLPIMERGRLVKTPRGVRHMELVRETLLTNGVPSVRVTHAAIRTRHAPSGQLKATEYRAATPVEVSDSSRPTTSTLPVAAKMPSNVEPTSPGNEASRERR